MSPGVSATDPPPRGPQSRRPCHRDRQDEETLLRPPRSARAARGRTGGVSETAKARARAPPKAAIQVAAAGPPLVEPETEVPGVRPLERDARAERCRQHERPEQPDSTASPPANANANGRKPTSRRACESDTTSARRVKSSGTRASASTVSAPPSTNGRPAPARSERRRAGSAGGRRPPPRRCDRAPRERAGSCSVDETSSWRAVEGEVPRASCGGGRLVRRRLAHDRQEPERHRRRREPRPRRARQQSRRCRLRRAVRARAGTRRGTSAKKSA